MIPSLPTNLDPRAADQFATALRRRHPGFVPEWKPPRSGADEAIIQITARFLSHIAQRLNRAPEKNKLGFLDLLGIQLTPAASSRAPIVFKLENNAANIHLPAGTRVAAPPPPESTRQIVFETERGIGASAAKLKKVVSLWPGRDQYIDHTDDALAGKPFQPFRKSKLKDTDHILYLAHDTLLALAGQSTVIVTFELTKVGSEPFTIVWEYWDGSIWREFRNVRADCEEEKGVDTYDSTGGLTRISGSYTLETDCAESSKTNVNGIDAFWIRGRLDEPLPPDSSRVLPQVHSIRLSTSIISPEPRWEKREVLVSANPWPMPAIGIVALDDKRQAIEGAVVTLSVPGSSAFQPQTETTNSVGLCGFAPLPTLPLEYEVRIRYQDTEAVFRETYEDTSKLLLLALILRRADLPLDKAFADTVPLDISKPFYPFGVQPEPGSVFYFTNEEAFSKPGALLRIAVLRAHTPQDYTRPARSSELFHLVSWEYWNGTEWAVIFESLSDPKSDLNQHQIVEFQVPEDFEQTEVNAQKGLWMRVRLVSGGFGYRQDISWEDAAKNTNQTTIVVTQAPALEDFRLGYSWPGPAAKKEIPPPEHVLSYNDFQYKDYTEQAKWPGQPFQPFKLVNDLTPALYLGFDRPLPLDRLGLFFDITEQREETKGPPLVWEYWDGGSWEAFLVDDDTNYLRLPGMISFLGPDDSQASARFDAQLHWFRARLKEDGPPGEPTFNAVYHNAVHAIQLETIVDEPIGASTGAPNQVLAFRQFPILDGEIIEVRESAGRRANVEWRIIALEVFQGNKARLASLETMLLADGPETDIQLGDVRLVRNRSKQVTEAWIRWYFRADFLASGVRDRHYVLEHARGKLHFGDGKSGAIPPVGAAIIARKYQTGGGLAGNVAAGKITQLLGPIGGIESASNPRAAEGGGDAETPDSVSTRGPRTIRHRGRALSPPDYEVMAREANASVAVARAIPCRNPAGRTVPGWVTLVIIPQSDDPRPMPSFGLREEVRRFVSERACADLAGASRIYVTGPDYLAVDVRAIIVPQTHADAGVVEQDAKTAIELFLNPLRGGPEGQVWPPGRPIFLSDVAAVLTRVEGLDYVEELELLLQGGVQGDMIEVPPDRVVVANEIQLKLKDPAV